VRVDGRVEGSIRAGEVVTVGPGGMVIAEIVGQRAEIWGTVIGNVVASERIHVVAGAKIVGDLRAPDIELAPGAIVEGRIDRLNERRSQTQPPVGGADPRQTVRARGPLRRPTRPPGSLDEVAANAVASAAAKATLPKPPATPAPPIEGDDATPTPEAARDTTRIRFREPTPGTTPPPPRPPRLSERARLIPRKRTKGET
jgi:cytoskeletal protein CcmA (bactofilin family)